MKKRLLSTLLAFCMVLTLLPGTAWATDRSGFSDPSENSSGSKDLDKLTKEEIVQLLEENPLTLPDDVFEVEPSYTAPYTSGQIKQEALQAAFNRLNALRRITGLPPVASLDTEWCDLAQYGAVLLSVSEFSHYPARPAGMDDDFYSKAQSATSTSNISAGRTVTRAVDGFMDDSNSSNIDCLGHRRWQLNPFMSKVGFGYAYVASSPYRHYVDEKTFERYESHTGSCDYDFVAWPASGNFPNTLFGGNIAWSVTVDPNQYQTPDKTNLTVTLTRQSDGESWTFDGNQSYTAANSGAYFNVNTDGYGDVENCIIFRPDGVSSYEGVYSVAISGLSTKSGEAATLSYQVDFFNPDTYSGDPGTNTYTIAFNPNGGNLTGSTSMTTGEDGKLSTLPTPAREGYTFDGWFTSPSGGTEVTTDTLFGEDTMVYAHWTAIQVSDKTYTITFNPNGGDLTDSTSMITDKDGKLPRLPASPTREDYTFDGWFTSPSGGTEVTTDTLFSEDTTIYAHWTGIPVVCGEYAKQYKANFSYIDNNHQYRLSLTPIAAASGPNQFTAWQAEYDKTSGKLLAIHLLGKRTLQDGGLEFDDIVSTENKCSLFVLDENSVPVIQKCNLN